MKFLIALTVLSICSTLNAGIFRNRHVRIERHNGRIILKQIIVTPKCPPVVPDNSVPPPSQPLPPPSPPSPPPIPQDQPPTPVSPRLSK